MKIYYMEQQTPEWFEIKKMHFTASNATAIMARGKGLQTLIKDMLCEYYSSDEFPEFTARFSNSNTDRGNKFESRARTMYEFERGCEVKEVGFVELDEHIGCSPDGLVGDDGLIEIKSLSNKVYFELLTTGKVDSNHINQMKFQLYVTGRKWCDYVAYNPNYEKSMYIIRYTLQDEDAVKITDALNYAKVQLRKEKSIVEGVMSEI